jgi:squalene synthase HpnC
MSFADDLDRYGPGASVCVTHAEALAYCARLAATHYENFSVVTWLTPRAYRPALESIYAFCRWSDDLGDEAGSPARALELLKWWRGELEAAYHGRARHPVMIALAETIARHRIPVEPFLALISAFEQDQTITRYETYAELCDYCTRSANPVGHLVLHVAGAFSPENARLADFTCTGLQLANFWQDVARDLAIKRVYLPSEDRVRFGVSEDDLRALRFTPEFAALMRFEVERARVLFDLGQPLLARLSGRLALSVDLFSRGGRAILDRVESRGFDVLSGRPALSRGTKLWLAACAMASLLRSGLSVRVARPRVPIGDASRETAVMHGIANALPCAEDPP